MLINHVKMHISLLSTYSVTIEMVKKDAFCVFSLYFPHIVQNWSKGEN